jgi:hypothetical protein
MNWLPGTRSDDVRRILLIIPVTVYNLRRMFNKQGSLFPNLSVNEAFYSSVGGSTCSRRNMQQMAQESVRCNAWDTLCSLAMTTVPRGSSCKASLKADSHIPRRSAKSLSFPFDLHSVAVFDSHMPCCSLAMPRICHSESDLSRPRHGMCELASAVQRRHVGDLPAFDIVGEWQGRGRGKAWYVWMALRDQTGYPPLILTANWQRCTRTVMA